MAKRRRRISGLSRQNPFSLCIDMFNAGMQTAELLTSSGQVIAHRSDMIARAIKGELPWHHKEFSDMWLEKFLAVSESMSAATKHVGRRHTYNINDAMNIMAPFRKKAASNAKRLRNKK